MQCEKSPIHNVRRALYDMNQPVTHERVTSKDELFQSLCTVHKEPYIRGKKSPTHKVKRALHAMYRIRKEPYRIQYEKSPTYNVERALYTM